VNRYANYQMNGYMYQYINVRNLVKSPSNFSFQLLLLLIQITGSNHWFKSLVQITDTIYWNNNMTGKK